MVAKFVVLLAVVSAAAAGAPDFSSFSYAVADPHTGDFKHQVESRAGDDVTGQYSLLEADGTRRTVDYAAGAGGFNALVRKDPALLAPAPYAAPALAYSAPAIAYSAQAPYGFARFAAYPYATPYAYSRYY